MGLQHNNYDMENHTENILVYFNEMGGTVIRTVPVMIPVGLKLWITISIPILIPVLILLKKKNPNLDWWGNDNTDNEKCDFPLLPVNISHYKGTDNSNVSNSGQDTSTGNKTSVQDYNQEHNYSPIVACYEKILV